MQDKTLLTDQHKKLEFISPDLPMSPNLCNYLLALCGDYATPEATVIRLAKTLFKEQVNDLNYYCCTH